MTTTREHDTSAGPRKDHKKRTRAAGLERRVTALRAEGATYDQIRETLEITARTVESVLGEVATLHEQGRTHGEIVELVGLPRTTVRRLLSDKRESRVNARSHTAAGLVVEMYGLQIDVLAALLGIDITHARSLARQLRTDAVMLPKLIQVQPGEKWLVPTKETAGSYLGWMPTTLWKPPIKDAEHYRAVAMARVMLVGAEPGAWISERQLRHDAAVAARARKRSSREIGHIHDGRFLGKVSGTYGWWALEVELTAKSAKNMDKALRGALSAARDAEPEPMIGLVYLYRGRDVRRTLDAALERLPAGFRTGLEFVDGDIDEEWAEFLSTRKQMRAATRTPNPNHRRPRRGQSPKDDPR
ncbi:hypothetical protein F3087_00720 [Nocardia colli]|uniref:Uncharacterized protein n=1 Tax=Nocardia colli TaxID=2545717 RepID=A0A5N0EPC1_9NOCA|nr:hypothetical protein [Nocardia colli]KAA8889885.1 hypothetical protein F3087_00720 [Nocardia colli]